MRKLKKTCFLITPLGKNASPTRNRADAICSRLVGPLMDAHDLNLIRGDRIPEQGNIMVQVIREVLDASVVVADLTGLNPNVLYELGIADAFLKPVLRLVDDPSSLPFDFRGDRIISVRSMEDGSLVSDDVREAQRPMDQFFADAVGWNRRLSSNVAEAIDRLPHGIGEAGLMRHVGGYKLANGWPGVEKALKAAGANLTLFRERRPKEIIPQFSVELVAALISDTAEIQLSFGDWTEQEVETYLHDLVRVLVDCGSPYRIVARHLDTRYIAEPGELLIVDNK